MRSNKAGGVFLTALTALLVVHSSSAARPNFDSTVERTASPAATAALERLANDPAIQALGRASQVDERFGVPTFFWAKRPVPSTPGTAARQRPTRSHQAAARDHLERLAPIYRLEARDLRNAELRYVHDTGRGGIVASFRQVVDGIPVFRDEIKALMGRNHELISVSGYIASKAKARVGLANAFRLSTVRAVELAMSDFAETPIAPGSILANGSSEGDYETYAFQPVSPQALSARDVHPIRVTKVLFHRPETLDPGYYVEIMTETAAQSYVVSAEDGSILFRNNLMANDLFTYRVWAEPSALHIPTDGPQGDNPTPHPTGLPDGFDPPFVASTLVTLEHGPISTNDPWLAPGSTQTLGNNVDAYADVASPDGFSAGDLRASTTSANTFDHSYDPMLAPDASSTQRMAAITQLFYTNNFLHDWFYDAGFDEASGNAQNSNLGRGGIQSDRLRAEAQDYSGTNNANMSTPADGGAPRMQMFVFTSSPGVVTVNAPVGIVGAYQAGTAAFGPQTFSVTADVVEANDGSAPTSDGCQALINAVAGKIVLVDRGSCTFASKAANAEAAGAVGVLLVNNASDAEPPGMGGTSSTTIPILSVTQSVGNLLRAEIGNGLNVTLERQAQTNRDGTIDNAIVAHEWGHYISNRLIGNSNGLNNQQGGSMGEGWGDFHALLTLVRASDALVLSNPDYAGVYPAGSYAVSTPGVPSNAYYFGIRRVPYSTNFSKNALTFRHITDGMVLPAGAPTAFGSNGASNSEVHNSGEVWCTMLWECYAALLADSGRLTFAQARDRMRDYLVAAYKLTPSTPTFLEARDAVLAAAGANDIADYMAFWQAFARRGAGMNAVAPDRFSTTHSGVVESYVVGGDLDFVAAQIDDSVQSCDSDGYLDDGEVAELTITLRNTGATMLSATSATISSTNPAVFFSSGNVISFPASLPFDAVIGTAQVALSGAASIENLDVHIAFNDPGLLNGGPRNADFAADGNADEIPATLETVESPTPPWAMTHDPAFGNDPWRIIASGPGHRFYCPDAGVRVDEYLISPPLDVAATGTFSFSFQHAHKFESVLTNYYDGGVIEISTNGGSSWSDVAGFGSPGYGGTLRTGSANPLTGRMAYVATSASFPTLQTVNVDLGTSFQGQTVLVRFRLGTDSGIADYGWEIDNIQFNNLTNTPFFELIVEPDPCNLVAVGEARPTAVAFAIDGANPVVDQARFRFALPRSSPVELAVFDVSGRRVANLANGTFSAGIHRVAWNRGGAAAGVYFARLRADGKEITRRVLILL